MSWVTKAHRENQINKLVDQVVKSKKYQDARKEDMRQASLKGFCRFCFIACEYLELKHGYKKAGLEKFLKFAKDRVEEIGEDESYFSDVEKYYKEELDIDVMDILRMRFQDEEQTGVI